jgi:hypothetical protein
MGESVALELDVLGALAAEVLEDDAALELVELLFELPHPLSTSPVTANVSDNAFSLNIKTSPRFQVPRNSIRVSGILMLRSGILMFAVRFREAGGRCGSRAGCRSPASQLFGVRPLCASGCRRAPRWLAHAAAPPGPRHGRRV